MLRTGKKQAQAAIELAVFGAVLIFVLGTIVRTAVSNGYTQNESFKAMRMALLASWNDSISHPGHTKQDTSRNSASILFIEDRLSPDFNKYGDIDRVPLVAAGSGTFSYNLLYPLSDAEDIQASLPIMDVYINGQHFTFSMATYTTTTITRRACPGTSVTPGTGLTEAQCEQNRCLRSAREWVGGGVNASQFANILPETGSSIVPGTLDSNGQEIFQALVRQGIVGTATGSDQVIDASGHPVPVTSGYVASGRSVPPDFSIIDPVTNKPVQLTTPQITAIQKILDSDRNGYKLFYTRVVNGVAPFSATPPGDCSSNNNGLCSSIEVPATTCPAGNYDAGNGLCRNTNGDMQYDLLRNGDYTQVEKDFPPVSDCTSPTSGSGMRCYVNWQWAASPATSESAIGLDASNNQYPTYDIDGRLKEVTVYGLSINSDGTPTVTYEDPDGGDIDSQWDVNSCTPRPGLQNSAQIYTFTQQGTYLEIKEGKLYNPETGQLVRSANKRDTVDLIQRIIQLSNNTGRFCNGSTPQATIGNDGKTPNPVEVCIPAGATGSDGKAETCFSSETNLKSTCFDANSNRLFVRSRLRDLRGRFWVTDATGGLKVQ